MHVPKSGGVSVLIALMRALPQGSVSEKRFDISHFCHGFRAVDVFPAESRRWVAHGDGDLAEMAASPVVAGHFCLATLQRLAPVSSIATIIREPRARLMSLYSFWRLAAAQPEVWLPYYRLAGRPLERFLDEP